MTAPPPAAAPLSPEELVKWLRERSGALDTDAANIIEALQASNIQFEATTNDALARAEAAEARNAQHLGAIEVWQREAQSAMQCTETAEADLAATKELLADMDWNQAYSCAGIPVTEGNEDRSEAIIIASLKRHAARQPTKAREEGR